MMLMVLPVNSGSVAEQPIRWSRHRLAVGVRPMIFIAAFWAVVPKLLDSSGVHSARGRMQHYKGTQIENAKRQISGPKDFHRSFSDMLVVCAYESIPARAANTTSRIVVKLPRAA